MIMGQMDDYVSSLAKMNVLNKSNTKSANLLNIQYKIMSKIFGPFLDLYVDLKSHVQTAVEVTESFTKATEETGEAVEKATGGLTAILAMFRQINIIMTFILIIFAAVAAALYMVSTTVGGAAADFSIFNDVVAAAQGVFTELIGFDGEYSCGLFGLGRRSDRRNRTDNSKNERSRDVATNC